MKDSSKKSSNLENGATLNQGRGELLNFKWGTLSIEEIRGILDALPMDLNFIDKDDLVQYYNESPGQVHKRNLDVFKKSVLLCHSESSKKKVEATLKALRMGKHDVVTSRGEAFGRSALWKYIAVKNASKEYIGAICITEYLDRK